MENNNSNSLLGLNAMICGSTAGIGLATAHEFALCGANVTLFAKNKDKLKSMIKLLKNYGNQKHQYLVGDFNNPDIIQNTIKSHIGNNNRYHILINNSGGPKGGPILNAQPSIFIEIFKRHLICNHILVQNLIKGMKEDNYGRIINIISTSVKEPIKGLGVSNTIRGAVSSWAKTLSKEIGINGITVNNILPGFTNTERLQTIISDKSRKQNKSENIIIGEMKDQIPLGRFANPNETAKAITFLASPAAEYINGISLAVDGGRLNSI